MKQHNHFFEQAVPAVSICNDSWFILKLNIDWSCLLIAAKSYVENAYRKW